MIRFIVNHLPRRFIYWAAIRLWVHGTVGEFSATVVGELTVAEALKRWEGKGVPDEPITAEEEAFLKAGVEWDYPSDAGREATPGWPPQDGGY